MIIDRHYKPNEEYLARMKELAERMDSFTLVRFKDESGNEINSLKDMIPLSLKISVKQKYSVYYVYMIVNFLSDLCIELEHEGNFFPHLREFFDTFRFHKKAEVLRKKTWNPY